MKKKFDLSKLEVKSFITGLAGDETMAIKGGATRFIEGCPPPTGTGSGPGGGGGQNSGFGQTCQRPECLSNTEPADPTLPPLP